MSFCFKTHFNQKKEKWSIRGSQEIDGEHDLQVYDELSDSTETTQGCFRSQRPCQYIFLNIFF